MVVAVYFTNWSIYARGYTPSKLPLDSITHVIYAFLKPDPESGRIEFSDEWADLQKPMDLGGSGCIGEFKLLKQKHPHLRVVASVGGYTYSSMVAEVLRNPAKRQTFVHSALRLVEEYGFDGIDIDWEYPANATDGNALLYTMQQLRSSLGPQRDLMIAAPAGPQNIQHIPMEVDEYLTCWNIMTYDFAGPWSPSTGHHAQLYSNPRNQDISADSVIKAYTRYIHPSKLVLGIPLYGRSFDHTKGIGSPFSGSLPSEFEAGVHDYKTLPLQGFKEYTDKQLGASYCQSKDAVISYDNATTVHQKAAYAKDSYLGGAMFWEASGDREDGSLIVQFAQDFK